MLLGCIVAGFCGTLHAPRGQHLSLDSHLAFAVSADTIRALDVVKKKVIRSELSCLISSLVHLAHKHAHSASASAYPIKCMSDRGPFALVHCVICAYGYGFGVILFRSSCNQLDRDFER
jgi:hypothetical protein